MVHEGPNAIATGGATNGESVWVGLALTRRELDATMYRRALPTEVLEEAVCCSRSSASLDRTGTTSR